MTGVISILDETEAVEPLDLLLKSTLKVRQLEQERDNYRSRLAHAIRDLQEMQFPQEGFRKVVLSIDQEKILRFALRDLIRYERSAIQCEAVPGEPLPDNTEDFIRQYGMLYNALFPRRQRKANV